MVMSWYKYTYIWLLLTAALTLNACESGEKEHPEIYFDSTEFLEKEWPRLEKVQFLNQELIFNGQEEQIDSVPADSASFKELFQLFRAANINKVIYSQQYAIDTFWIVDPETNANIGVINYHTSNADLPVEWFHVYEDGSVKFKMAERNFLFSYEKEVFYKPEHGFSIISSQKSLGQDTLHIFKTLEFI